MAKKYFVLHEEVIDVVHTNIYIPTIEKLSFNLVHVRIIGSMECGKTRNDFHDNASTHIYKVKERICRKIQRRAGIEIQSQHWGVNRELPMEGISVEYFTNSVDPGRDEENQNLIII